VLENTLLLPVKLGSSLTQSQWPRVVNGKYVH